MLTKELTDLLDASMDLIAGGASYIPGEAGEITAYVTTGIAAREANVNGPLAPLAFVDLVLNLAVATAAVVGKDSPKGVEIIKLVSDISQAVKDGEHGKVFQLLPDLLKILADAKALKK